MNKTLLNELLKEYEQKRIIAHNDLIKRKSNLYKEHPRLQEIENELNSISIHTAKLILKNNNESHLLLLKEKMEVLKQEREDILVKLMKPQDFFSPNYSCKLCQDTGYIFNKSHTVMCNCMKQKLFDLEYNKSNMSNLDKETFKHFDLSLYSNEINKKKYDSDISPRENIQDIKKASQEFINHFNDSNTKNLLFSGGTGLGKTFLSNCIINELIIKGKTILYQTAPVMLDTIISNMFHKKETTFNLSSSLLSVDLLVIDDLGTETMNSMKFTELYKIINTRLLNQNGKITKTIISTNLDLQNLLKTYDERIVSRLIGYYDLYRFFGDDIRFKKR